MDRLEYSTDGHPDDGMVWDAAKTLHTAIAVTLGTVDPMMNLLPLNKLEPGMQSWFLRVAERMLRNSVGAHLAEAASMQIELENLTDT